MHMLNLMSYNHINQYALLHKFFCVNKTADNSFSTFYYYVFEILCHGKKKMASYLKIRRLFNRFTVLEPHGMSRNMERYTFLLKRDYH